VRNETPPMQTNCSISTRKVAFVRASLGSCVGLRVYARLCVRVHTASNQQEKASRVASARGSRA